MTKQFHGITSLGLVGIATILAAIALFQSWWVLGLGYLALAGLAGLGVIYAYCAKCPCKAHCGHVLPGKAAMAFNRKPGPYTPTELGILVLALLVLIGLPQFWLWPYTGLFVVYWLLNAIAMVQIRGVVCRTCNNVYCPFKIRNYSPPSP
ncbi:MAG: hypothetical protein AB1801_18805 [Chloroflexota bacterium]